MTPISWSTTLVVLVAALCLGTTMAAPSTRVKRENELSAEAAGVNPVAAVSEASQQSGQAVKDAINPTRPPLTSTTDDTPDFDRTKVSLQVPDALFGSSFTLVTNISTRIGNLIMSSARRAGEFLWIFQPLVGNNLRIELPTTTTTTTTPRTTTSRATTTARSSSGSLLSNEI
ncbi:uncharacterized protein LOC129762354 isoform X2 [Toxorhynchites rutilus septentrionalis]|uniref:uncharacterized protein LOC129762354 isoform X2 n=1 Tax=Toxorhynchites rutilus septentrionalis TaxID=329112 RepID=UPI002478EBD1|nr:uncharacterized protein LOC129762354 isoform X2 [Toxorhynchites rutilus septentrionalis]